MTTKMILDVDTGVDDAMAILTAVSSPEIELLACTVTWGNIDVDQGVRNTSSVLNLAGVSDVPVARGAEGPRDGTRPERFSEHVHGPDGQGGQADASFIPTVSGETAVETILRLTREHPGEIEIVAVGPFTNIAAALDADPSLPDRVRGVTVMGGAFLAPGNATPVAEANIIHDVDAAQAVIDAGWRVTFVGLDVTMKDMITEEHRAALAAGGEVGQYVAKILDFYFDFYRGVTGVRCAGNHDALAVAVAAGLATPTLVPTLRMQIDTTDGPGRGQTIADMRPMSRGWNVLEGARHRAVLEMEPGFTGRMVELLAGR